MRHDKYTAIKKTEWNRGESLWRYKLINIKNMGNKFMNITESKKQGNTERTKEVNYIATGKKCLKIDMCKSSVAGLGKFTSLDSQQRRIRGVGVQYKNNLGIASKPMVIATRQVVATRQVKLTRKTHKYCI